MTLSFRMTTNRLVLWRGSLMAAQIWSSVVVQPSCSSLPHMPWLSGVAEPQLNPGAGAVGTVSGALTSGGDGGSVPQASATTARGMVRTRGRLQAIGDTSPATVEGSVTNLTTGCIISFLCGALACSDTSDQGVDQPQPEPELPADARIEWDPQSQMVQIASTSDCDSWTPTWAPDGNLYSAFGDCRPEGVPQKIGMGFGRISGADAYSVSFSPI